MAKKMWDIKQQTAGVLNLYIYGDVEGNGYDWWTDEVIESETSAEHFREALKEDASQINIYINSWGGSVFEGTAIYNQLKRHKAHKTVYIDGFACSIASVIAMAGDEIIMPRNTLMMIHNMWTWAVGNSAELRKAADDLEIINKAGRASYLEKAGDKLEEAELERMQNEETWLTAEECIKYGLADSLSDDVDMSGAAEMLKKANLNIEQRINIQKSLAAQLRNLITPMPEPKEDVPPAEPERKSIFKLLKGE